MTYEDACAILRQHRANGLTAVSVPSDVFEAYANGTLSNIRTVEGIKILPLGNWPQMGIKINYILFKDMRVYRE